MLVNLLPISTEPLQHQLHDLTGKIGNVISLRDEEAAVVDDQRQAPLLLPVGPPDPFLPQFELVSPGAPNHQSHPLALILGYITQLLTHDLQLVKVVPLDEHLIETVPFF